MNYRAIELTDVPTLAVLRMDYLRETTRRDIPADVLPNTVRYLETTLAGGTLVGIAAVENGNIVAHGMLTVFDIMPTVRNLSGKRGYLFNFYTRPEKPPPELPPPDE